MVVHPRQGHLQACRYLLSRQHPLQPPYAARLTARANKSASSSASWSCVASTASATPCISHSRFDSISATSLLRVLLRTSSTMYITAAMYDAADNGPCDRATSTSLATRCLNARMSAGDA